MIVSGATGGIGQACVRTMAAAGWVVAGFGRSGEKAAELEQQLQAEHGSDSIRLAAVDIRDSAAVADFVAGVKAESGRIDGLVNAAGLLHMQKSHKVGDGELAEQWEVLFGGTFTLTRQVLPIMIGQKDGLVVNIGSVTGTRPAPGMAVYGAAKAAVQHLTASLAAEYAAKGVRFLCLNPGPVRTGLMEPLLFDLLAKKTPLQRVGEPQEVADLVRFLFSDEARFMTGSTITLDGGAAL
jgi:NAD(P)-dependent dehydrogenase (short-subunit alcohol dehydrogenase family)